MRKLLNSLSRRFLALTVVFVMLAEVLIFVPSVARFRADWLILRLEKAQIASLALLASDGMIDESLERELLENAGVYNVVLRRDEIRQLVLSSPVPSPVTATFDLREAGMIELMRDALEVFARPEPQVIRVIGNPVQHAGLLIEITTDTAPMRVAMIDFGLRILVMSALISAATALLLFLAVRRLMVFPIARVVRHMSAYASAPEDARRIITPTATVRELRVAEEALLSLQTQLTAALRQKERLAQLGSAVAKISHDLRNILATVQLFADRIETSDDPVVKRAAPKLLASVSRAMSLCESTLAFGRAEEPAPRLVALRLRPLVEELIEGEGLGPAAEPAPGEAGAAPITVIVDIPETLELHADPEQLYRVLANLLRNARQAIETTGRPGTIEIGAGRSGAQYRIRVGDTGPGLPPRAREHLFAAFQGAARKGGSGLGLAISAELIRGHGGTLSLNRSDAEGTEFEITLPAEDPARGTTSPQARTGAPQ